MSESMLMHRGGTSRADRDSARGSSKKTKMPHPIAVLAIALLPLRSAIVVQKLPIRQRGCAVAMAKDADDSKPGGRRAMPIDFEATERESREEARRPPARANELAAHLPPWAAAIALDPVANQEYETTQQRGRAAALKKTSVEGRTWEGLDSEWDPEGATAGAAQFTPSELAEDYNLPLEGVCEALIELGVPPARVKLGRPVRSFCSQSQLAQLLEYLATCDPIAAREARAEETLEEMADGTRFSADDLVALCRQSSIAVVLGADTRIQANEVARLRESMERELAWRPARTQGDAPLPIASDDE